MKYAVVSLMGQILLKEDVLPDESFIALDCDADATTNSETNKHKRENNKWKSDSSSTTNNRNGNLNSTSATSTSSAFAIDLANDISALTISFTILINYLKLRTISRAIQIQFFLLLL